MRLRLSIRRHNLPAADLLWAVPGDRSHDAFTVANLLEHVNDIIPLESPHWGLEDYAVEIGSYEALHFQNVKDIFRDDDQVCVRHLTQPELRARHIAGRDQINANGQHLIDGIPFGKPLLSLRKPGRPVVNIPPLKNPVAEATDGREFQQGYINDYDEEDEDDEDFAVERPARKRRRMGSVKSDKSDKSVHFQDDTALVALPSDGDTEEDFQPASDDALSSSSASDSSSDDSAHPDTNMTITAATDASSARTSGSDSSSDTSDSSSDVSSSDASSEQNSSARSSSSDSDSSSSASESSGSGSEPDVASSKAPTVAAQPRVAGQDQLPKPQHVPFQGLGRTKARNRRRQLGRFYKKMQQEAEKAIESPNTEILESLERKKADLLAKLDASTPELSELQMSVPADSDSVPTGAESVNDVGPRGHKQGNATNAAERELAGNEAQNLAVDPVSGATGESVLDPTDEASDVSAPKRKRIDVGSFRRLTMGSLGLRAPKNKEEEQKLREKIAASVSARGKKRLRDHKSTTEVEEEPEDLQDPDAWKSRVELMAFEVCDTSVERLSTPPYPFKQRWDAQQHYGSYENYDQQHEAKNKKKGRKKNKKAHANPEQHHERDINEEWGFLDYDEPAEGDAAQPQLLQGTQDRQAIPTASLEQTSARDDLPSLPSDVTTLQKLLPEDIRADSLVVYREIEVSELTGWQPIISDYRRATVLEIDDGAVLLKLAAADVPGRQAQTASGNKAGKHGSNTFLVEDEEDDDPSERWVEIPNLVELRLLKGVEDAQTADKTGTSADGPMSDGRKEDTTASETDARVDGVDGGEADEGTTEAHSSDTKEGTPVAEN